MKKNHKRGVKLTPCLLRLGTVANEHTRRGAGE